jgi:hypothetical protein
MSITGQNVIEAIRTIVAAAPNTVYQPRGQSGQCMYVHNNREAGCLVAQALVAVGVPVTDLIPFDAECGKPAGLVMQKLGIIATPDERDWVGEVQRGQDKQWRWDTAVIEADEQIKV